VLPAALLAQLVAGISQIRAGKLRDWGQQVLALGMCAAIAASGITSLGGRTVSAPQSGGVSLGIAAFVSGLSPEDKQQAYKDEVAELQDRTNRLQAHLDGFPKELTDVEALAATLTTPQAAFEFVRDQVALEPYPGVLKGARATLLTRGGNPLDRALLLAAILKHNGVAAKIAHGKLAPEQAQGLLQQIAASPGSVELMIRSLAVRAPAVNPSENQEEFGKLLDQRGEKAASDLRDAVEKNLPLIQASVKQAGLPGRAAASERQLEILADHYWVQATVGGQDTDLDPSLKTAVPSQKLTDSVETLDPDALADPLFQSLRFRVVGEFLDNGSLETRELLSKEVKATDLFGKNLRLAIAPFTFKANETRFRAMLLVGDDRTVGQEFRLSGQAGSGAVLRRKRRGGHRCRERCGRPTGGFGRRGRTGPTFPQT
jgi:hypothetical protein